MPDQVYARLRVGQLGGPVRVDGAARVHVGVDQRRQRGRAPAAPGRGRGAAPTARTGPAGTRSATTTSSTVLDAAVRRPTSASRPSAGRARPRRCGSPVTASTCPASTAACARSPSAPRAGSWSASPPPKRVADDAAAQQPDDLGAGSLLGQAGERDQAVNAECAAAGDRDPPAGVPGPHVRVGRGRAPGSRSGRRRRSRRPRAARRRRAGWATPRCPRRRSAPARRSAPRRRRSARARSAARCPGRRRPPGRGPGGPPRPPGRRTAPRRRARRPAAAGSARPTHHRSGTPSASGGCQPVAPAAASAAGSTSSRPRREQPHVVPLRHRGAGRRPRLQHQRLDTALQQVGRGRQPDRPGSDDDHRHTRPSRSPSID